MQREGTLAQRLGVSTHVSPLRRKLLSLFRSFPSSGACNLEEWLVDVANHRGARIVIRTEATSPPFECPPGEKLSNEELVVGLMLLDSTDQPQSLRLVAQIISRDGVDARPLLFLAERERTRIILAELARQALRAEPGHSLWKRIHTALADQPRTRSPILHWTRLAEPVMRNGRVNAESWKLVS